MGKILRARELRNVQALSSSFPCARSSWSQGELVVAMQVGGLLLFAALRGGMDTVCGGGEVGAIRPGTLGASS